MASYTLPSSGFQSGEESRWLHNPNLLAFSPTERNQNGYVTPTISRSPKG